MYTIVSILLIVGPVWASPPPPDVEASASGLLALPAVVVDDFEAYPPGTWPDRWKFFTSTNEIRPLGPFMNDNEKFYVVEEEGNRFLRAYTAGQAQRISIANDPAFDLDWDLTRHPRLAWKWRALQLPRGAREDAVNDTGAAIYVTFSRDWLGRPRSIKYTYSTALPVGTVVSFGRLKVIVAASGLDGYGDWIEVERNVVEDYVRLFGKPPPDRPLSITLWSDSDDTKDVAEVDFDDIVLLDASR
ncbi:MAG: DUF3047 domain-containing protein [Bacteroidetes bacterium]|nr:hypothetical protein AWN76_012625 [Rhodothermaceae bacterium RA]RMH53642.1 MAG: DUF3047 domain-containing protein [Bacteroidota bacterium]